MPEQGSTTLVFDLDDTLYCEDQYNISGVQYVCSEIRRLYNVDLSRELLEARENRQDIWALACRLLALPDSIKQSFLWLYRLHQSPSIQLGGGIKAFLESLHDQGFNIVLLTDGRSVTQRQKIEVLGLSGLPVYISEEYESEKPDLKRFQQIMSDFPADRYAYIGDNPAKDFIAPNSLGWLTVGIRGNCNYIHSQELEGLSAEQLPGAWLADLLDLKDLLS